MPDDVVGQAVDLVVGALGHLGEALGLGLVLEGVAGKVDACVRSELALPLYWLSCVLTYPLCGHRP